MPILTNTEDTVTLYLRTGPQGLDELNRNIVGLIEVVREYKA